VKKFKEKYNLQ